RQIAKPIQIDRIRALRNQVRVDEREVGELILGIVVDVLGRVPIQHLKGLDIGRTPAPPGPSLSWTPPSSLYCCHRSVSMISAADRNLRMATSPCVRLLLPSSAKAGIPLAHSPAPRAPAPPIASPLRKKERRLLVYCDGFAFCS